MDKQELALDEVLIQKEADAIRHEKSVRQDKDIINKLKEKEKNQKSISDYYQEIKNGFVQIDDTQFEIKLQRFFNNALKVPIIADDIGSIESREDFALVNYTNLETSLNLFYTKEKIAEISHDVYQEAALRQAKQMGVMYEPVESGNIVSGNNTLIFSSAITESEIGYLFCLSFYGGTVQSSLLGSFTCRLRKQYSYQNLFKAMMQCFYEMEEE